MILFLITIATLMSQSTFFNVRLCLAALSLLSALTYVLLRLASKSAFFARLVDKLLKSVGILSAFAVVVLVLPQVQTFLTDSTVDSNSIVQTQDFPTASEALKPSLEPSELEKASSTHETEEAPKLLVAKVEPEAKGEDPIVDKDDVPHEVSQASHLLKAQPGSNTAETESALEREAAANSISALVEYANSVGSIVTPHDNRVDAPKSGVLAKDSEETIGSNVSAVPAERLKSTETEATDKNAGEIFDKIAREAALRVIRIEAPDKSAIRDPFAKKSGSLSPFPGSRGVVFITCDHVVCDAGQLSEITAYFPKTSGIHPDRIYSDPVKECTVFAFDDIEWDFVPQIRDVSANPIQVGEACAGIGCRLGMNGSYFETKIAGIRGREDLKNLFYREVAMNVDLHLYQLNEHVESGDSGGSVYDGHDLFIGLIKAKVNDVKTGFVTPADVCEEVVADAEREWYGSEPPTF